MSASPRQSLSYISLGLVVSGLFAVGLVLTQSLQPNKKADDIHAWIEVPLSDIDYGTYRKIKWIGLPLVIFRPDRKAMSELQTRNRDVWGPDIESSTPPKAIVYIAISTYKGCGLVPITAEIDRNWPPGWLDPCHMGAWDLAGRAYKALNVAPGTKLQNLRYVSFEMRPNNTIAIHR